MADEPAPPPGQPPSADLTCGDAPTLPYTFGRYWLEQELGRGGMGAVFKGEDTLLGRTVAVKIPFRSGPAAGAAPVFLPPYSPDLNPIEMAFSKLKAKLRKARERTAEGLRAAVFAALQAFPPEQCANFLRAAGYHAT